MTLDDFRKKVKTKSLPLLDNIYNLKSSLPSKKKKSSIQTTKP
jgi:hypothetical protein